MVSAGRGVLGAILKELGPKGGPFPLSEVFYLFNGDADGICALRQFQGIKKFKKYHLISGTKRETALLKRLPDPLPGGAEVYCFDIPLDRNRDSLARVLAQAKSLMWYDHHHVSGDLPQGENVQWVIDESKAVNTSYLVFKDLGLKDPDWAIVGMFGDHLAAEARALGSQNSLDDLSEMGRLLNYNAYGRSLDELHFDPHQLAEEALNAKSPLGLRKRIEALHHFWEEDLKLAQKKAKELSPQVFELPNEDFSFRMLGEFASLKASENPEHPHAILCDSGDYYVASIRAPRDSKKSAGEFCRIFGGGGRVASGGINELLKSDLRRFLKEFSKYFQ